MQKGWELWLGEEEKNKIKTEREGEREMSAEDFWGAEEKYGAANKTTACGGERKKQREESG